MTLSVPISVCFFYQRIQNQQIRRFKGSLTFRFDKTIPANSYKAHQFLHFCKTKNLQKEAKEKLMHAYFIDGKNIDDKNVLIQIGNSLGLSEIDINTSWENPFFATEVKNDIKMANQLQITGVPYFVFNRKYSISGAQDEEIFLKTIQKILQE